MMYSKKKKVRKNRPRVKKKKTEKGPQGKVVLGSDRGSESI